MDRWGRLLLVPVVALLAAGCANRNHRPSSAAATSTTAPQATAPSSPASESPVWLCRPGAPKDPCTIPLTAVSETADGTRRVVTPVDAADPPADCFYVYPTVSTESGANSDLQVQPAEINIAEQQAAPFSQVCRVWAPMYRQATLSDLLAGGIGTASRQNALDTAYLSLEGAFEQYLDEYNQGRPIVFIGHSQGTLMLIRLLRDHVEDDPALLHRMVVAVLLGGNVEVPTGRTEGATFSQIPACTTAGQTRCVIAYSTFNQPPPADSLFGRPGQGVSSLQSGQASESEVEVLCTNPTALTGGAGATGEADAAFYLPAAGRPAWTDYPDDYQAQCRSAGGATWLQVSRPGPDVRPAAQQILGPTWGLHLFDVNLFSGNLVDDVGQAIRSFQSAGSRGA